MRQVQTSADPWAMSLATQIIRFGVKSGGLRGNKIAEQIGGSARGYQALTCRYKTAALPHPRGPDHGRAGSQAVFLYIATARVCSHSSAALSAVR